MMSLFNLFRKSEKNAENITVGVEEHPVDKSLFVDAQEPTTPERVEDSALVSFLQQNYMQKGYQEGYLYPNADLLEANIRKLGSDFRWAIDQLIDRKRSAANDLKLHLIDTRGISERLEEGINHKIREVENLINELDAQKILSIESEGMIASAVNDYRIGFTKGIEQYQQEKFIAGSTRLF